MTGYNPQSNQEVNDIMRLMLAVLLFFPLLAGAQQAENDTRPSTATGGSPESSATVAATRNEQEAGPEYTLVDLLGGKNQMLDIQTQLVDTLMTASPQLQDYQVTVAAWAQEYLQWSPVRERLAAMYRSNFSAEEIDAIVEFYRSPAGRKLLLLTPTLMREGMDIGLDLAEAHKPELIDMLRAADEAAAGNSEPADGPPGSPADQ
jgi:hypothetical protein